MIKKVEKVRTIKKIRHVRRKQGARNNLNAQLRKVIQYGDY